MIPQRQANIAGILYNEGVGNFDSLAHTIENELAKIEELDSLEDSLSDVKEGLTRLTAKKINIGQVGVSYLKDIQKQIDKYIEEVAELGGEQ